VGSQPELIACLDKLRSSGIKVSPLNDKDKDGASFLIKEMDPFTFFGSLNRQTRDKERLPAPASAEGAGSSPKPGDCYAVSV
jgi:hypothetical protein